MKISLRHPAGLEIDFEGDEKAFDRFAQFLSAEVGAFINGLGPGNTGDSGAGKLYVPEAIGDLPDDDGPPPNELGDPLDPREVARRIENVGAKTDIQRVTVIAQAAMDAGLPGIDYPTIEKLYGDMGLPKPLRFAKAFSNAKSRGLVRSIKQGTWATTVLGENYARFGTKPPKRTKRLPAPSAPPTERPRLDPGDSVPTESS